MAENGNKRASKNYFLHLSFRSSMRYGIFSDVHSNLEAFRVALDYYKKEKIDKFIFLGDIVGYAASPNECVSLLKGLSAVCIAGNHDWAAIGEFSLEYFNSYAKAAIIWTKNNLEPSAINYIGTFNLSYEEDNFLCVHGTIINPQRFDYILDISDAKDNFSCLKQHLCFIGHSHLMEAYFLKNDKVYHCQDFEIELKNDAKYIINVGSVGQPRDRDSRACLCIYDTDKNFVKFIRLEYNIEKCAKKILDEGIPSMFASRLYLGE